MVRRAFHRTSALVAGLVVGPAMGCSDGFVLGVEVGPAGVAGGSSSGGFEAEESGDAGDPSVDPVPGDDSGAGGSGGGSVGVDDEGGATEGGGTSGWSDTTTDGGETESETEDPVPEVSCEHLPSGPFIPAAILQDVDFFGSEDLAFDGQGFLWARGSGGRVLRVSSTGDVQTVTTLSQSTVGLEFDDAGNLIAAARDIASIVQVSPDGTVTTLMENAAGVSRLYADEAGALWYSAATSIRRRRSTGPDEGVVIEGLGGNANGVVYDHVRQQLFYAQGEPGRIRKVDLSGAEPMVMPDDVANISSAVLDGLTMDGCGNLYAVDRRMGRVYRVTLDAAGTMAGPPELLGTDFDTLVSSAKFGAGPGWDDTALYVIGFAGGLYRLDVGVPRSEI